MSYSNNRSISSVSRQLSRLGTPFSPKQCRVLATLAVAAIRTPLSSKRRQCSHTDNTIGRVQAFSQLWTLPGVTRTNKQFSRRTLPKRLFHSRAEELGQEHLMPQEPVKHRSSDQISPELPPLTSPTTVSLRSTRRLRARLKSESLWPRPQAQKAQSRAQVPGWLWARLSQPHGKFWFQIGISNTRRRIARKMPLRVTYWKGWIWSLGWRPYKWARGRNLRKMKKVGRLLMNLNKRGWKTWLRSWWVQMARVARIAAAFKHTQESLISLT